jgi:hypothetical protein
MIFGTFWSFFPQLFGHTANKAIVLKSQMAKEIVSINAGPGLPDGLFSNQISKIGYIFEGLGMYIECCYILSPVGIFYGH